MVRRRRDLTPQEFESHWLGPHADIVRRIPGLRGYTVNLVDDPAPGGWDGVAETWFDSIAAAIEGFAAEPARGLLHEDRKQFIEDVQVFFVKEHQIIPCRVSGVSA